VNFNLKLADISIGVKVNNEYTKDFCKDYLTDEPCEFSVEITQNDIDTERKISKKQNEADGIAVIDYPDEYLEVTALYRKIVAELLKYSVLLFHGCVVALNGKAYMFIAKSGTGKTTHANLWLKNIKDSYILNGDKPLLLFRDKKIYVCGTPWQGKENFGKNEILPLDGICILERGENNSISSVPFKDAFSKLIVHSHHPQDNKNMMATLDLMQNFKNTNIYCLKCNMDNEAAFTAYRKMVKRTFEEELKQNGKLVYKNVGKSMMPLIRENKDIIIIKNRTTGNFKKYDAVLYKRPSVEGRGAYILHRILKVNSDGTYWIVGDNCRKGETVLNENILGILSSVVRDKKTVNVDDLNYKIYVHLWCDLYPVRFALFYLKEKALMTRILVNKAIHKLYLMITRK